MTPRYLTVLAGATVLALAACGGTEHTNAEQAYLDTLYDKASEKGSGIKGYGDEKNLKLATAACNAIGKGHAPTDVVQNIEQDPATGVREMAPDIVGLAQLHLCPAQ